MMAKIDIGPRLVEGLRDLHDRLTSGRGVKGLKQSVWITCPLCRGNGKPCPECHGYGRVRIAKEDGEVPHAAP
jgi:hypothetical protein